MPATCRSGRKGLWGALVICATCAGCVATGVYHEGPPSVPRELKKVTLPPYVIDPPDELQINAIRLVPKPPYRIEPLDSILIQVPEALQTDPIAGIYPIN